MNPDAYDLSPRKAAELLGVSQITVKRWAKSGVLKALKTPGGWWRFSAVDIDAFISTHTNQPAAEATA